MNPRFEEKKRELRFRLLDLGTLDEEMIHLALTGLLSDEASAGGLLFDKADRAVFLGHEIHKTCHGLLALHQPAAEDLRTIFSAIRIASDLERISGLCVNIYQATKHLIQFKRSDVKLYDIPRMAENAKMMLKEALNAFLAQDLNPAYAIFEREKKENEMKSRAFNELLQLMQADASTISQALGLILISRNLEKIADHATNIAENVIFIVKGSDIRHQPSLKKSLVC